MPDGNAPGESKDLFGDSEPESKASSKSAIRRSRLVRLREDFEAGRDLLFDRFRNEGDREIVLSALDRSRERMEVFEERLSEVETIVRRLVSRRGRRLWRAGEVVRKIVSELRRTLPRNAFRIARRTILALDIASERRADDAD